jgi:hypothetical protein
MSVPASVEALHGTGGQPAAAWGQQKALGSTAPIQRNGVRHLDANDPLRRAALATPSKGKGGMKYLSITCSECRFEKGRKHYSNSQLKKNAAARCNQCCAGEPSQRDAEVEAEKAAYPTVMRGLEGRLCWGCASIATGHEVYCQTCKKIPTWFCVRARSRSLDLWASHCLWCGSPAGSPKGGWIETRVRRRPNAGRSTRSCTCSGTCGARATRRLRSASGRRTPTRRSTRLSRAGLGS